MATYLFMFVDNICLILSMEMGWKDEMANFSTNQCSQVEAMMEKVKPIRGRCLCGTVQFELLPPTDFCAHCHCESCRLSHASAFVTWTSVPQNRFSYIQGKENVKWYRSSECILWGFCQTCGSQMFYQAEKDGHPEAPKIDRMYISAGSITDPLDRAPQMHVSYEEKLSYMKLKDGLPKHRGKTEERMKE